MEVEQHGGDSAIESHATTSTPPNKINRDPSSNSNPAQSSPLSPNAACPHLPDEIWLRIVKYAIESDATLNIAECEDFCLQNTDGRFELEAFRRPYEPISGQILRVSRWFHEEGRRYLYGQQLAFEETVSTYAIRDFLDTIGPQCQVLIKNISIWMNYGQYNILWDEELQQSWRSFPSLETLTIWDGDRDLRLLEETCGHLFELMRIAGSLRKIYIPVEWASDLTEEDFKEQARPAEWECRCVRVQNHSHIGQDAWLLTDAKRLERPGL